MPGFAAADFVVEDTFRTGGTQHVPMEPHVTIADARRGRDVQVWSATQTPYLVRAELANLLGLPQNRIRVMVPTLGSGYGAKTYPKLEPLVVALSRYANAPVKLALDRREEFLTVKNHESLITIRTGVAAEGHLVAREVELYWDAGAYADISPRFIMFGGFYSPGPYRIPNVRVRSHAIYTNKPPSGAFRGFANPQAAQAFECQLDMIAERLGRERVEFRLANLLRTGDEYATGETMEDAHFAELRARRGRGDRRLGGDGGGPWRPVVDPSRQGDRRRHDGHDHAVLLQRDRQGQGRRQRQRPLEHGRDGTGLADGAGSDRRGLGCDVPLERVRVVDPDTDVTPFDLTTSASRSTFVMGDAVRLASDEALAELRRLAENDLEVSADDLELRNGGFYVVGTHRGASFGELVTRSLAGTIVGRGTRTTSGGLDPANGQGSASAQWHQCAAAVEVAVDVETGRVTVERLHVNTFTGRTINETNAELQLEGAAIFGLGQALYEELEYDDGDIVNANLAEYLVPTLQDVPALLTTALFESPDPDAEVHGIGENGMGPVPGAVASAIHDAAGVWIRELPITPEKVLRALRERQAVPA